MSVRKICVLIVFVILFAGCTYTEKSLQELSRVSSISYTLHEVPNMPDLYPERVTFSFPVSLQDDTFFFLLDNGQWGYTYSIQPVIGITKRSMQNSWSSLPISGGMAIVSPNGSVMGISDTSRSSDIEAISLMMFFDTGDIVTAKEPGQYIYKNGELIMEITDPKKQMYSAAALRDNQYFRVCNSQENMVSYYQPMDLSFDVPTPHYALFHYFERLTEYKYRYIYAAEDCFVGVYYGDKAIMYADILNDNGNVLYAEVVDWRSRYPEVGNSIPYDGLCVKKDEESKLFYYVNARGKAVCEPTFEDCTNIKNGTALVKIKGKTYILVIESAK